MAFLKEIQVLQLASGTCGRAVRMLGCCKLDGDPCIVMTLYPKSAAKLLEENAGQHVPSFAVSMVLPVCAIVESYVKFAEVWLPPVLHIMRAYQLFQNVFLCACCRPLAHG